MLPEKSVDLQLRARVHEAEIAALKSETAAFKSFRVIRERDKVTWELLRRVYDDPDATMKDKRCALRTMVALRKIHGMEMLGMHEAANRRREIAAQAGQAAKTLHQHVHVEAKPRVLTPEEQAILDNL